MKLRALFFIATILCAFLPCRAVAQQTPAAVVRTMLDDVLAVQNDPQLQGAAHRAERRDAIKKIIAKNFYFDAMAKNSLGKNWDKLSAARRQEFTVIFKDLFQDSYTKLVLDFLKREKISYDKEQIKQPNAFVSTRILRQGGEIPVDYTLLNLKGAWLVEDVAIDKVSIVQNYNKSFSRVIAKEGYKNFLQKLRTQQKAVRQN